MASLKGKSGEKNTITSPISIAERINKNQSRDTIVLKERKHPPKVDISSTLESQALFNQAMEIIRRNRHRRAIKPLKEALHIAPDNPYYLSYLGLCLAHAREDFDVAVTICKHSLALCPGDTELQVNLGRVYKLMGDNNSAYSVFLDAWRRNKEHPGPAAELSRMGIRRPPVIPFLKRSSRLNKYLGILRSKIERMFKNTLTH